MILATNTPIRRSLLFLFIIVSVLGFSPEKASAQCYYSPGLYVPTYFAGQGVTAWYSNGYLYPSCGSWYIRYFVDGGERWQATGGGGGSIGLGALGQGWHTLYAAVVTDRSWYLQWGLFSGTSFYVCSASYGALCSGGGNSCGDQNYGYIQCDGSCSASGAPAERPYYNTACTSYPNACGVTTTGTYNCSAVCSATTPANPAGYGTACTSPANACGVTTTGTIQCNGACSATTAPANPSYYGQSCTLTSAPNACGQTTTGSGLTDCNGVCTGTTPAPPSNATCTPSTPTVSGLYKAGAYRGPAVPSFDPTGYQLYAQSVSPANFNLTYYFEFSKDGVNWTGDPLPPIGSWSVVP